MVTGGTRGIGRAIAERLLREGASVAICGRSAESVDKVIKEWKQKYGAQVFGAAADVSKLEDVRRFFDAVDSHFGGADFLINNAGIGIFQECCGSDPGRMAPDYRSESERRLLL